MPAAIKIGWRRALCGFLICVAAGLAWAGGIAMAQQLTDAQRRAHRDQFFPLIEQGADPPGRYAPSDIFPGSQRWSGRMNWSTRHGQAVVRWSLGRPVHVDHARLPDGKRVDIQEIGGSSPWRYRHEGEPRRWTHGTADIRPDDVAFVPGELSQYNPRAAGDEIAELEITLANDTALRARLVDSDFADALYVYLKNGVFAKVGGERICSIGLSSGAGLVAGLRGHGDVYTDFYPHGGIGPVTEAIVQEVTGFLAAHGWRRALPEDFAAAAIATRRDLTLWEQRSDAPLPEWAQKLRKIKENTDRSRKAAGPVITLGHPFKPSRVLSEQELRENEEVASGLLKERLYQLAVSGRISETEWQSMSRRIFHVPFHR